MDLDKIKIVLIADIYYTACHEDRLSADGAELAVRRACGQVDEWQITLGIELANRRLAREVLDVPDSYAAANELLEEWAANNNRCMDCGCPLNDDNECPERTTNPEVKI